MKLESENIYKEMSDNEASRLMRKQQSQQAKNNLLGTVQEPNNQCKSEVDTLDFISQGENINAMNPPSLNSTNNQHVTGTFHQSLASFQNKQIMQQQQNALNSEKKFINLRLEDQSFVDPRQVLLDGGSSVSFKKLGESGDRDKSQNLSSGSGPGKEGKDNLLDSQKD